MPLPPRTHGLKAVFQMFDILGVDLRSRWLQAKTSEDVERIWNECKADAKKAYRDFAKKLHPDVNPDPRAHEEMKHLTQLWAKISGFKLKIKSKPPPQPPPQVRATYVFWNQHGVGTYQQYGPSTATTGVWGPSPLTSAMRTQIQHQAARERAHKVGEFMRGERDDIDSAEIARRRADGIRQMEDAAFQRVRSEAAKVDGDE